LSKFVYRVPSNRLRKSRVFVGPAAALVLFVLIAGGWTFRSSAQGPDAREAAFNRKADRILRSVRHAVEEDKNAKARGNFRAEASAVNRLSRIAKIKGGDKNARVNVAVTLNENSERELAAAGFRIQSRVGDVATLDVDVDQLPDLAAIENVKKIFASVVRRPLNDRARQSAGIENSSGQRVVTQTGRGVVVGIVDTGIDFRHLDFTVPGSGGHQTRIKALLDMTEYGAQSPDPGWNYSLPGQSAVIGHLYTEAEINSALQLPKPADQNSDAIKQRDKAGHGTHVAGTAAGNGLAAPTAGSYAGMAPEADLIIVKASRENDGEDDFGTTDIINALEFIRQKAAELGEPFLLIGDLLRIAFDTRIGEEALIVQLLADEQFALRLDQIVIGLRDLPGSIEPVARDPQILTRDAAELARNLRLARQHIEAKLGIGERRERLARDHHRPVLHQRFLDLPARQHADQGRHRRRHRRAHGQIIVEAGLADRTDLDIGVRHIRRPVRGQQSPE